MIRRRALWASLLAVLLLAGGAFAYAASSGQTATCTPNPVTTTGSGAVGFTVHCSVPIPAPSTVTTTVTVTGAPTSPTTAPTTTGPPTTTAPPTTAPPTTAPPTTTPPTTPPVLSLPRMPWSGGNAYYQQFPSPSNYKDPAVFPLVAFYADGPPAAMVTVSGINTVERNNSSNDFAAFAAAGLNVIENSTEPNNTLQHSVFNDPHWVGWWLTDETDGQDPPSKGQTSQRAAQRTQTTQCPAYNPPTDFLKNAGTPCKFERTNYTGTVTSYFNDTQVTADQTYVNMVKGAVSVDGYYYTDPSCDDPNRHDYQVNAPDNAHCRTSAAYGNFIDNLRTRDAAKNPDGSAATLQPLWGFVELGAANPGSGKTIQPDQIKGAVMSEIIHGANGIDYFDVDFGTCGGEIIPSVANGATCNAPQVAAAKQVNGLITSLAPVLNTQSYVWDFGAPNAATMLKVSGGSAYVLADVALNKNPGTSTFTLPAGVTGTSVEVIGEGRTLPVAGGTFTDTFASESSYHVYRITL